MKLMFTTRFIEYNSLGFNETNQEENMNKLLKGILAALMVTSLAACSSGNPEGSGESGLPENYVTIQINTEGLGAIAVDTEGKTPEIDKEYPSSSIVQNVESGTTLGMIAEGREGFKFSRWTKDGADFSTDAVITVTADADVEYIAVFQLDTGYDGEAITDIKDAKVIGDILALPSLGNACFMDKYVTAFELNGTAYRVIAEISEDLAEQIFNIDFSDPDHNKIENELVKDLAITKVEKLEDVIPSDDEIAQFKGKTGAELLDAGWLLYGHDNEEHFFYADYGVGQYQVFYEGKPDTTTDDLDEMFKPMTVTEINYIGIGDFSGGLN